MSAKTFAATPNLEQQLVGLDWGAIPWDKVVLLVRFLVDLFGRDLTPAELKAATGHHDDEHCKLMHDNVCKALCIIDNSLACCENHP